MTKDWIREAATYIHACGSELTTEHIISIISTHAEPLVALLREAKREHLHDEGGDNFRCCSMCSCNDVKLNSRLRLEPNTDPRTCDCGADEWNARIDEVLK